MKKIMFNDKYGLTKAVLEGRKTMTRRIARNLVEVEINGHKYLQTGKLRYKFGEVIAVAQSLRDMGYDPRDTKHKSGAIWSLDHTSAWTNKMFVSASECIHQIRITGVRVERLQYISDEDCIKEGVGRNSDIINYSGPRNAFAALIDRISGKGTWKSNPWVFVYEFELIK